MNKYQEALQVIKYFLHEVCHCTCQNIGAFENDLQELVDKETPIKPIINNKSDWSCPKCGGYHTKFVQYYCEFCGQKIDWNLNKEENKNENS